MAWRWRAWTFTLLVLFATWPTARGQGASTPSDEYDAALPARSTSSFPWCQCVAYDCGCSPYQLQVLPPTRDGINVRSCFRVTYVGCDTTRKCCRGMLAAVDKLALETSAACSERGRVLGVTLNGRVHESWNPYVHGTGAELKIYNLQRSNATFAGVLVCVTTAPPCGWLNDLCVHGAWLLQLTGGEACPASPGLSGYVITSLASSPAGGDTCLSAAAVQTCLADRIISGFAVQAPLVGSEITVPFTQFACAPQQLTLYGAFATAYDGHLLYDWLNGPDGMQAWVHAVTGGDACSQRLSGYTIRSLVTGPDAQCLDLSSTIIDNMQMLAFDTGAVIVTPFAQDACSLSYNATSVPAKYPFARVCGAFLSADDGALVADPLKELMKEPEPPPKACVVCVYIYLLPPAPAAAGAGSRRLLAGHSTEPFAFDDSECGKLAKRIDDGFKQQAALLGANIQVPFRLDHCTPTYLKLMGTFGSARDGEMLQEWLNGPLGMLDWVKSVTGECPDRLSGYAVRSAVQPPNNDTNSCLVGDFKLECFYQPPPSPAPPSSLPPPVSASASTVYSLTDAQCLDLSSTIIDNMQMLAFDTGAVIVTPFAQDACSLSYNATSVPAKYPFARVCGAFLSADDGALVADPLKELMKEWVESLTGGAACSSASLSGHLISTVITDDVSQQAADMGSVMLAPFALTECSDNSLRLCGTFQSAADGAALGPWLEDQSQFWLEALGGGDCSAELAGYSMVFEAVAGPGGGGVCLQATSSRACAFSVNAPPLPRIPCEVLVHILLQPPDGLPAVAEAITDGVGSATSTSRHRERLLLQQLTVTATAADASGSAAFSFDAASCAALSTRIATGFAVQAPLVGSDITVPFTQFACAPQQLVLYGSFATAYDGFLLYDWLNGPDGMQAWVHSVTGGDACSPELQGYLIRSVVTGPSGELAPSCMAGGFKQHVGPLYVRQSLDQFGAPAVAMCTRVSGRQACRQAAFCCDMDFAKIEVPINPACRNELRRIAVNRRLKDWSWGSYPSGLLTVKFESLITDLPDGPDGAELCWLVNIFSTNNKCCPSAFIS
eukprot:XP_001697389.1 predicted protein [Chlamydomonas reinhardtii]